MQSTDGRAPCAPRARCVLDAAGKGLVTARKAKPQTVAEGVERDLAALPGDLGASGLALCALELARQLDGDGSPTGKAAVARALQRALGELRAMGPAERADVFDEIAARRAARVAKGAR